MRVFILAGEPSGDKLGGALMAGLKALKPDVTFEGIGGPVMADEGLESRFDMAELSVMGLAEILPKYRALKARINQTAAAVVEMQPDVLITIDSPDFSLRVARQVKAKSDVRCVHYVAPTVWAWRPGRAEKMARFIDQVLALLPFEPPYMEAAGMRCDFVGHPVVAEPVATQAEALAFRARHSLGEAPLLLVLPGSRQSEVARLGPVFQQVVARLVREKPELRVVIPAAAPVVGAVRRLVQNWSVPPVVLNPLDSDVADPVAEKRAAFRAADVALAASGTVSLELAASETPMVIAYDMNWVSRQVIGRMVKVDTVTLVNLVSETRAIPEYIGANCRPGPIAQAVVKVLETPEVQEAAMALAMQRLGQGGEAPGLRAAKAVLDGISRN
ncbi:lipid-A-disaccharide synthase [Sulfitobacter geojensis]|uniref:Lipid-A-disaccharide synthase n=1 Tax=Sulfitobacter geojensis TaxID=1342299 RepID=A0AAE2VVX7_9RHOB|nr:lipid-A-disaccharide synthase [Sulfitobacter geojensis]MBM1692455.1 lipid-A-disaccharide synthase [Sulfitobacter geojensis]MBM1704621.1 lipid-A-disaccharide synthase [Sulfitobacter geojensis]MBM1708679.1 lipid-A-disaccharide synthase [Sulfitobacter geojensis]MBM1712744.1 lipid-A-disaccharide synthase [Sulfitobacter geojensis]